MPHDEDIDVPSDPPVDTDLYDVLGVRNDATPEQIKSAYRKQALKHHPDKAPAEFKEEASRQFQQIAFAYAILSDERRRRRFDLTGSTAEAVDDDEDFDWVDFYREQFSSAIDTGALDQLKQEYQGSDEEKHDVLAAFEQHQGDLDKVYESVMLCNVLDDDERFRAMIDQAIADGTAQAYKKYMQEPEKKRQQRVKRAQKEAKEAEQAAKELEDKKGAPAKRGRKKGSAMDNNDLAALIQQRQASRAVSFFDRLEEKYNPGKKRGAKVDEPPEEAFAAMGSSKKKKKAA
ncbi:DnaJ domain-containing protein [Aspergillus ambiguus]|uniref:DnaJ domain protein n=1 Tax=Aspergillus ambiguus TaxID=176160 RepID=UPI003CCD2F70